MAAKKTAPAASAPAKGKTAAASAPAKREAPAKSTPAASRGGSGKPAKKAAPAATARATGDASAPPRARPATKAAVIETLTEKTGLGKKDVALMLGALHEIVAKELGRKGPGVFVIPGLLRLKVIRKPATRARQGLNPFTKEPMTIKAKPARNVVKAVPLKSLTGLV